MMVPLAFPTALLNLGLKHYMEWDTALHPHLLVLGNSGSGKTYFIRQLLGMISITCPHSHLWILDFKNEDFRFAKSDGNRYWGYRDIFNGFDDYFSLFQRRLEGDPDRSFCVMLIDEVVSAMNSLERKEMAAFQQRLATLLFMSRSFNMHIILGAQRGMAEHFPYGSRDCLNVCLLGSPSKESIRSFCSSEEAAQMQPCGRGAGYTVFDGQPPVAITVPTVQSMENLQNAILRIVSN